METANRRAITALRELRDHEPLLWGAVAVVFVLDVATTYYGIARLGAVELNPLAAALMESLGVVGASVAVKASVVVFCGALEAVTPELYGGLVPFVLATMWVPPVVNNVLVIVVLI